MDPRPRPNELRFDQREIVADDQDRHPGPLALHRLREGIVKLLGAGVDSEDTGTEGEPWIATVIVAGCAPSAGADPRRATGAVEPFGPIDAPVSLDRNALLNRHIA